MLVLSAVSAPLLRQAPISDQPMFTTTSCGRSTLSCLRSAGLSGLQGSKPKTPPRQGSGIHQICLSPGAMWCDTGRRGSAEEEDCGRSGLCVQLLPGAKNLLADGRQRAELDAALSKQSNGAPPGPSAPHTAAARQVSYHSDPLSCSARCACCCNQVILFHSSV